MKTPDIIYLQKTEEHHDDLFGLTWCADKINDTDVKYVRYDILLEARKIYAAAKAQIIILEEFAKQQENIVLLKSGKGEKIKMTAKQILRKEG